MNITRRTLLASAAIVASGLPVRAQTPAYAAMIAAAKKEGKVTIYTSTDEAQGGALTAAFRTKYPEIQIDYNDLGTNGVYSRAISESAAKQITADILWTPAMDQLMTLVEKGFAESYVTAEESGIPAWAHFKNMLFATSIEPIGMIYNKRFLKDSEAPTSRADLLKLLKSDPARFRGKVATFDPEKSGTGFLFHTNDLLNSKDMWDVIKAFGALDGKIYSASGAMKEKVVSGEHVFAFNVIGSYALDWAKADSSIGVTWAKEYTPAFSRVAFISKGAPHPNAAKLFLDFMLSKDGQSALAAKGVPSVRTDVQTGLNLASLTQLVGTLKPIPVDEKLTQFLEPARRAEFFRNWKQALRG